MGPPDAWKKPWFTSERWSKEFFKGGRVTDKFLEAYGRPNRPTQANVGMTMRTTSQCRTT